MRERREVAACSCTKPGERCGVDFYRHQRVKDTGEEKALDTHRGGTCVRPREGQTCAPSDEPPEADWVIWEPVFKEKQEEQHPP